MSCLVSSEILHVHNAINVIPRHSAQRLLCETWPSGPCPRVLKMVGVREDMKKGKVISAPDPSSSHIGG